MTEISKLKVLYNGTIVGYLKEEDDRIYFQYDPDWRTNGFSLSPKSLPLDSEIRYAKKNNFNGLFGVFADSLPDGWGELLTRRKLAKDGIDYDHLSPLTKLSLTTDLTLGGLNYEPCQSPKNADKSEFDFSQYAKKAKELLDSNIITDTDFLHRRGGSSGGTRPKAFYHDKNDWWMIKFPCRYDPKGISEKEFLANECAEKCGIHVNRYRLFSCGNEKYFGCMRFDRDAEKRIHMISASALLEVNKDMPILDYKHLFLLVRLISANRKEDYTELYRRMCFNVYLQNKDDHGGNFSFLYSEKEKGYRLSPFYDITSTPEKAEHETTILGEGNPSYEAINRIGEMFEIPNHEVIRNSIKEICQAYSQKLS